MPENPIRLVECPYCQEKFGVRYDQAVEFCFFCGGTINLRPKVRKPWVIAVLAGKLFKWVVNRIQEELDEDDEPDLVDEISAEPTMPFKEETPVEYVDDYRFDPVNQLWIGPSETEEDPFLVGEDDGFDPLALIESDLLEPPLQDFEKEPFDPVALLRNDPIIIKDTPAKDVKIEPFDPIDLLRPAAGDIPTAPVYYEEVKKVNFFTKQRLIIFGAVGLGILIIVILILVKAAAG